MPWISQSRHKLPMGVAPSGKTSSAWRREHWQSFVVPNFQAGRQSEKLVLQRPKTPGQYPCRLQTSWQASWCEKTRARHFRLRFATYRVGQRPDKVKTLVLEIRQGDTTIQR